MFCHYVSELLRSLATRKCFLAFEFVFVSFLLNGCTVKAVGDPNRPITINAHITIDIKGLKDSASNIEDFVSGEKPQETLKPSAPTGGQSK